MAHPIFDPTARELPTLLQRRPVYAQVLGNATYRMMEDIEVSPSALGASPFFVPDTPSADKSGVAYFTTGAEAFEDMAASMKTAVSADHFIYIANWFLDLSLAMGGTHLRNLLQDAASNEVQVRALLFRNALMSSDSRNREMYLIAGVGMPRVELRPWDPHRTPKAPPPDPPTGVLERIIYRKTIPASAAAQLNDPTLVPHNEVEVDEINALYVHDPRHLRGWNAAILDGLVPLPGAHHQKLLIVKGSQGLIAYVGGVDFNPDRLNYLFDVHCRLTGPAAKLVLDEVNLRWLNHPSRSGVDFGQPHLGSSVSAIPPLVEGTSVNLTTTYACGPAGPAGGGPSPRPTTRDGLAFLARGDYDSAAIALLEAQDSFPGYAFEPHGRDSTWEQVKRACTRARRFIYVEQQYFVSTRLAQVIAARLPTLRSVIILVQAWADQDTDMNRSRTLDALRILRQADVTGRKVRVFSRIPGVTDGLPYVHSKVFVVDDDFAIIGSANAARRSYNCDSEMCAGLFDPLPVAFPPAYCVAHRLRIRLWAKHLGMDTEAGHAALADGVAAVAHWERVHQAAAPVAGVNVWRYDDTFPLWQAWFRVTTLPAPSSQPEWDMVRDAFSPAPQ